MNAITCDDLVFRRGDGTLAIEVKYPDGKDSLPYENVYVKSANAEIALNGKKEYEKEMDFYRSGICTCNDPDRMQR